MVSGDGDCNFNIKLSFYDHRSLSHCNVSSLDLNTSSIINALHACVDSPCLSCVSCLNKYHDDMLALSLVAMIKTLLFPLNIVCLEM
jgi:hypothetical protein